MNAPNRHQGGVPLLPDEFSEERLFRARTIAALLEAYRRITALEQTIEHIQNAGRG